MIARPFRVQNGPKTNLVEPCRTRPESRTHEVRRKPSPANPTRFGRPLGPHRLLPRSERLPARPTPEELDDGIPRELCLPPLSLNLTIAGRVDRPVGFVVERDQAIEGSAEQTRPMPPFAMTRRKMAGGPDASDFVALRETPASTAATVGDWSGGTSPLGLWNWAAGRCSHRSATSRWLPKSLHPGSSGACAPWLRLPSGDARRG